MNIVKNILPYRSAWSSGHEVLSDANLSDGGGGMSSEFNKGGEPRHLMNEKEMNRVIANIAQEIAKRHGTESDLVLLGIRTRGVPIAQWIARVYQEQTEKKLDVGILDINLYRDDLSEVDTQPVVKGTELPVAIRGRGVILVDDVLFTGRTIRAALDALVDFGRPRFVELAVMIDRGFRELPIQADYIGKKIKTTLNENVKVMVKPVDDVNQIIVKWQQ